MDIENLIEQYRQAADKWEKRHPVTDTFDLRVQDVLRDAATALSTLHAENEKLRADLEQAKAEVTRLKHYEDKCHDCPIVCAKTEIIKAYEELEIVQDKLEQVKRERDEAVKDLRVCSIENRMECQYCLYRTARSFCWDCTDGSNWQWRGVKEEQD